MTRFILWFFFGVAIAMILDIGTGFKRDLFNEEAASYLVQYRGGPDATFTGPITDTKCHEMFDKLMHDDIELARSKPAADLEQLHVYCVPTVQAIKPKD
jgi:hypothetical protein